MAKATILTSVYLPNNVTHIGRALCDAHLQVRLHDDTLAIHDGVRTSLFECDDCKEEAACQLK